jgi:hypothetical protein
VDDTSISQKPRTGSICALLCGETFYIMEAGSTIPCPEPPARVSLNLASICHLGLGKGAEQMRALMTGV